MDYWQIWLWNEKIEIGIRTIKTTKTIHQMPIGWTLHRIIYNCKGNGKSRLSNIKEKWKLKWRSVDYKNDLKEFETIYLLELWKSGAGETPPWAAPAGPSSIGVGGSDKLARSW